MQPRSLAIPVTDARIVTQTALDGDGPDRSTSGKFQVILSVAAEGGGITLIGRQQNGVWEFLRNVSDWTPQLIDELTIEHASQTVDSWRAALALMDRYPWHRLGHPEVHPEFGDRVWRAYEYRWRNTDRQYERYRGRWEAACGRCGTE